MSIYEMNVHLLGESLLTWQKYSLILRKPIYNLAKHAHLLDDNARLDGESSLSENAHLLDKSPLLGENSHSL